MWEKGKKFSKEHCENLSKSRQGKPKPEGFGRNHSKIMKQKWQNLTSNFKRTKLKLKITCQQCGKEFEVYPSHKDRLFCSKNCWNLFINKNKLKRKQRVPRETRTCPICGKQFETTIISSKKFCNHKCYAKWKKGQSSPFKNHIHTKETIQKIKNNKERSNKISKSLIGFKQSEEHCKNKSIAMRGKISKRKGIKESRETKLKKRQAAIKYIEKTYGNCFPRANKSGYKFFRQFDDTMETKGMYRDPEMGMQEYQIKELGYFPDYINFNLKLIIEIDEKHHFEKSTGLLKEKDIQRQQEIQEFYPDFEFIRITEKEMLECLK